MQPPSPTPPFIKTYKAILWDILDSDHHCMLQHGHSTGKTTTKPISRVFCGSAKLVDLKTPNPQRGLIYWASTEKKKTFNERFETATKSNEEVLGEP